MTRRSLLDLPVVTVLTGGRATFDFTNGSLRRLFVADTGIDIDSLNDGQAIATADPRIIGTALAWQEARSDLIFMADGLSTSVALDSNFRGSHGSFTHLGQLEAIAKRERDSSAIDLLAGALTNFVRSTTLYEQCSICAVPPSPEKTWHLPTELAKSVARACDMQDRSDRIRFRCSKPSVKDIPFEEKLVSLQRAGLEISGPVGEFVLLIDDKYQSGTTAQFIGSELVASGTAAVHGLFCVKTWRDRDNMSPPGVEPG